MNGRIASFTLYHESMMSSHVRSTTLSMNMLSSFTVCFTIHRRTTRLPAVPPTLTFLFPQLKLICSSYHRCCCCLPGRSARISQPPTGSVCPNGSAHLSDDGEFSVIYIQLFTRRKERKHDHTRLHNPFLPASQYSAAGYWSPSILKITRYVWI